LAALPLYDASHLMRRGFLPLVVAVSLCTMAPRPMSGESQLPQFRAGVDLVHLDVSVLDNGRRPVRGLTAADFEIFEDGKPQPISTFSAVDIPDAVEPSTPWMSEVPPDTRRNDTLNDRRLFVMVLDDATAQADLAALKSTKLIARRFIERLGPSDLMAIVFTLNNRNTQDYTSDRARLLGAVDKFNVGFRDLDSNPALGIGGDSHLYFRYTIETLLKVSELMVALPEQRKALVYVGQGVPVDAAAASTVTLAGQVGTLEPGAKQALLIQRLREAFRKAERANVAFYTLDTCGLRGPGRPTCNPGLEVDFLRGIAEETGGYSTADTNDFEHGITQIYRENASYYVLGFVSSNRNADGKFRRIEVRVRRPGLQVRTRTGYTTDKARGTSESAGSVPEPLALAIAGLLPKKDVPLQAWAAPFVSGDKGGASIPIALGLRLDLPAREERINEIVDVRVDAYAADGKLKSSHTLRTNVVLKPGPEGPALYEVLTSMILPTGRYQLRMAASLSRLRRSGSVYFDVDVPDVSKGALTWSGVAFHVSPGVQTAASTALQTGIPIAPTGKRLFSRTDNVTAFARIYQGGKSALAPVSVTVSLTDSTDRQVWKDAVTLDSASFTTVRGADVRLGVPVAKLEPGPYRLRLEAKQGSATVVRDSRFTVR
jgi:VWFA-related protein